METKTKTRKAVRLLGCAALCLAVCDGNDVRVQAEGQEGTAALEWRKDEEGREYWYENGVRQGYRPDDPSYRGKEIYDPVSDAWYWLDNVQQGAKAVSKDVYQESEAGLWSEEGDGTGKWVRYDGEGHMVKGWSTNENGTSYFDPTYGTMAKGTVTIDGSQYHFDENTGIMTGGPVGGENGSWAFEEGVQYWYEGGVRQGYDPRDPSYRGKEIYDPESDAWYWLDNVQQGAKAVSKDVYQESIAGQWGDHAGEDGERYGKWVRYDESGHMVKGWNTNENGTYYFDPVYGTMAKGQALIDGTLCEFDGDSGILIEQKEMDSAPSRNKHWQDYQAYSSPVTSYLCEGKDGGFYRVEYIRQTIIDLDNPEDKKRLIVEEYNKDHFLVDQFELPIELSIWGGFYAGNDGNYFVFGEKNDGEDDGAEVFRIVKYSKEWERLGAASLYGANTTVPFDASSVRMAETDHILYVITGHEMYTSDDGYNHQANVHIAVDKDKMEITDSRTVVFNISTGYVSHSFNQFIQVDQDRVLTLNHGDAYPRAIVLGRFRDSADAGKFGNITYGSSPYESLNVISFQGEIGDNATGATVGGFEVSDTSYLIAGNMVAQDQNWRQNMVRNIFLAVVPKEHFPKEDVLLKQLTDFPEGGDYSASTPQLVEISKDRYAVLWEEKVKEEYTISAGEGEGKLAYHYTEWDDRMDNIWEDDSKGKVKIAYFDGEGNQLGEIQEMDACISDCHPVVINGKLMWYSSGGGWFESKPSFYYLPVK